MQPATDAESMTPALLRALVEQAPDAMIYADRSGAIRLWNRAAERVFGYGAAEVMGASLDLIIPERLRDAHWAGFRRAMETGETRYRGRAMTTRAVRKDGSRLYLDFTFGLVTDPAGTVVGALAIGRAVTGRRDEATGGNRAGG